MMTDDLRVTSNDPHDRAVPNEQNHHLITWQQTLDMTALVLRRLREGPSDETPGSDWALSLQMHRTVDLDYSGPSLEDFLQQAAFGDLEAAMDAVSSILEAAQEEYGVPADELLRAARDRGPRRLLPEG